MHDTLPVAAAAPLADVLTGPQVRARTALVGRFAAFLVTEDSQRVLSVATPGAAVLPCAVVLPSGADPRSLFPPQSPVVLGGGQLTGPSATLVVRRWWAPPAVPTGVPEPALLARAQAVLPVDVLLPGGTADAEGRRRALAAAAPAASALATGNADAAVASLLPVLGLGPGSTPSGDDVTAAVLLGSRAFGAPLPAVQRAGAALLAEARSRTTPVSAGLLAEAAAGRAVAPLTALVQALLGSADVATAVRALLDLGHTSGTDMAVGLLASARAAVAVPTRRSA